MRSLIRSCTFATSSVVLPGHTSLWIIVDDVRTFHTSDFQSATLVHHDLLDTLSDQINLSLLCATLMLNTSWMLPRWKTVCVDQVTRRSASAFASCECNCVASICEVDDEPEQVWHDRDELFCNKEWACFHPSSKLPDHDKTWKIAMEQKILKTTLMCGTKSVLL